ncbi:MAG TPA: regulatory protein RecX [Gemmatimonadaceae bacterium]|jgi:regulatory protein
MTPGIITAITPSPRKPGRFSLEVDGQEVALISIEAIERLKLGTGRALDARGALEVEREAGILETYDRALNMLAARGRSSAELRRLLVKKGEPREQVDVAIGRLESAGFLDDASFARQFTRSKAVGGGLSRRRVQQELAKRGVAREVSVEAVEEVFVEEEIDETESIERVARKKLKSLMSADAATRKRRLYGFLARRGYDSSDISRVLRDVLADTDDADGSLGGDEEIS